MNGPQIFPRISVVIPAYYPGIVLQQTLDSISNIEYPKNRLEVLVVSVPKDLITHNVVRDMASKLELDLKLLVIDSSVLSVRRNLGIQNSKSDIVLVVDDDIRLHKKTLARSIQIMSSDEKIAVVEFPVVADGKSLRERLNHVKFVKAKVQGTFAITACAVFNKTILMKVGLYREDMGLPNAIHEEWELGSRIRKKGFKVLIDGSIYSDHLAQDTLRAKIRNTTSKESGLKKANAVKGFSGEAHKNYRTFFIVMKSSPLRQRLEYSIYFGLPLTFLALLFFGIPYFLLMAAATLIFIEMNSLSLGHYRVLNRRERIVFPLIAVFARVIRVYLSILFLLADATKNYLETRGRPPGSFQAGSISRHVGGLGGIDTALSVADLHHDIWGI